VLCKPLQRSERPRSAEVSRQAPRETLATPRRPPPPRLPSTLHPRELASSSTLYLSRPLRTAMAQRTAGGLLRRSLGLAPPTTPRALSTSATTPAEGEAATKARRNKKKNLFDVAQFLPDWGVGYRVAKTTWRDVSYQITKINLYKDGRHGKAWGIRHKAGESSLPPAYCPLI
uniref:Uncharacterized protein n=1 Tax=Aegilops tauschii subsp. strangulata TaxID=200361 RepID=A0A453QYG5_AEGTS